MKKEKRNQKVKALYKNGKTYQEIGVVKSNKGMY